MTAHNEPAFPTHVDLNNEHTHLGMTLRDYFANSAMLGIISDGTEKYDTAPNEPMCNAIARQAYVVADAMLLERQKGQQ